VAPQGPSKQIKIEQIRKVVEAAPGRPYEGTRRVWILDGVEAGRFGAEAANAFLKTLEEPPAHVCFLLLASNPTAVLPTIRSRCQQLVLPGAVAVARHLGHLQVPPELASSALAGHNVLDGLKAARSAMISASRGEVLHLLRLARLLSDNSKAFELATAAALEAASSTESPELAEELVRLSSELQTAECLTRSLNLNRERQIQSCLLSWFRRLGHGDSLNEQ
jgi:DNA polymerase-3 subunit delta'